jgi:hypothetical protein
LEVVQRFGLGKSTSFYQVVEELAAWNIFHD